MWSIEIHGKFWDEHLNFEHLTLDTVSVLSEEGYLI